MRTGLLSVFAVILTASCVLAQTNTVSQPAGFVRVMVPTNSEVLLSVPFDLLPSPDVNDALYGQLSGSTNESTADVLRKWDPAGSAYESVYKADGTGGANDGLWFGDFTTWSTSTLSILPGEGFFIGNRQSTTQTVFLCGLVVLDSAFVAPVYSGMNLFGNPYPSGLALNDSSLMSSGAEGANPATDGDQITDHTAGVSYWLLSDTNSPNHLKWVDTNGVASAITLDTGTGFWFWRRGTNGFDWTEARPYGAPFPVDTAPPAVQDMYPNAAGDELTLDIQASGETGELLEVYYKDLAADGSFSAYNWLIAATGIESSGSNLLYWIDTGSTNRLPVNSVHSRYYLVARGDIDSDSDTLPDARETFVHGTDAALQDTDSDLIDDGWESANGLDPLNAADAAVDSDGDGFSNLLEYQNSTDPMDPLDCPTVESVQSGAWSDPATWNAGFVPTASNDVRIANGHIVEVQDALERAVKSLTVEGFLTHLANVATETAKLQISSSSYITIASNGLINLDGKGYAAKKGPGGKPSGYGGGTYGGKGASNTALTYGDAAAPAALGSGGRGTAGGGAVKLSAPAGTVTVDGVITAGAGASDYGGGSGGSIWIVADTLQGSGTMRANGGDRRGGGVAESASQT